MKNLENLKKNGIAIILGQLITFVIQFINRAVFVHYLNIELLGYLSLFNNVFAFLAFSELGVETIISVHLYRELSRKNDLEIGKLIFLYKWIYRFVAFIVLLLGCVCSFFLSFFIKKEGICWNDIYIIYFMQLFSVFIGYFLSYKRTLFVSNQEEYKCINIEVITRSIIQIIQLVTLVLYHNFFLYLIISLSINIISNLFISHKCNKEFPFINQRYFISKEYLRELNFFSDLKNFAIHKICYVVYGATDNIIISMFCGIRAVALYSNYVVIQSAIQNVLLYQLSKPLQAIIGNNIYSNKSKDELWNQFKMLDIGYFILGSYIGLGFIVFSQVTIQLWLGADYLLSDFFIIILSFHLYLCSVFENVCKYRNAFGNYRQDRGYMIVAAITNIILSICGTRYLGIEGVLIGTFISTFFIFYGRIYFVVKKYFDKSVMNYLSYHLFLLLVFILESFLAVYFCSDFNVSIYGIANRILIWFLIPTFLNTLVLIRNKHFLDLLSYVRIILKS